MSRGIVSVKPDTPIQAVVAKFGEAGVSGSWTNRFPGENPGPRGISASFGWWTLRRNYRSGSPARPGDDRPHRPVGATCRIMASSLAKSIGLVRWAVNPASRLRRMSSSIP